MCTLCLVKAIDPNGLRRSLVDQGPHRLREGLARILCVEDGACPEILVANTLEEEPCDGRLPCGGDAHHAWRERILQADRIIDASPGAAATPARTPAMAGAAARIPARGTLRLRHAMPVPATDAWASGARAGPGGQRG